MLEGRDHQHSFIIGKHLLGAVAVMDIEIHHRDAIEPVRFERVGNADRDAVEDAEAHRARGFGVVSGWPHHAERIVDRPGHYRIGGRDHGAGRAVRRLDRIRIQRRVRIEIDDGVGA